MSRRQIIEVPYTQRSGHDLEIYYTDPVTGKQGLKAREKTNPQTGEVTHFEVFDAKGNRLYYWHNRMVRPFEPAKHKAAMHIAHQSFQARGVM